MDDVILTLNAGSSSLKCAVFDARDLDRRLCTGSVERLGGSARLTCRLTGQEPTVQDVEASSHAAALSAFLDASAPVLDQARVVAVGHRIVHGGTKYVAPMHLDDAAVEALTHFIPLAPLHQPHNLEGVRTARARFLDAAQIGCFDTAFHSRKPWLNDAYALPRRFYDEGVRRYGFHGLSYASVYAKLRRKDPFLAAGQVVIAHLGNGASVCAIRDGRSVATTMGFSALEGLAMGTRCGRLDPGVIFYLMREKGMSVAEVERLLYSESGMKGLSGVSSDMRDLMASGDPNAADALAFYVSRAAEEIAAMSIAAGGQDVLVFCGGVGENAPDIRARICSRLSAVLGDVNPLVIETDEELEIADAVLALI